MSDVKAMMIDLQLALAFAPSVPASRILNRAAKIMQGIGYKGCENTLDILATHERADMVFHKAMEIYRRSAA